MTYQIVNAMPQNINDLYELLINFICMGRNAEKHLTKTCLKK